MRTRRQKESFVLASDTFGLRLVCSRRRSLALVCASHVAKLLPTQSTNELVSTRRFSPDNPTVITQRVVY